MAFQILKCENCGAQIERDEDRDFYCPYCGFKYVKKDEIHNTNITNNQSLIKFFIGDTAKEEIDNDKVNGYLLRMYDAMELGNYSEARELCNQIIIKDPYNKIAMTIKGFLTNILKQENGRYRKVEFNDVATFVEYLVDDNTINDHIEIFDLAKRLLETTETMPDQSVLDICKQLRQDVVGLNNDYTQDFLNTLTEFEKGIQKGIEKIETHERELEYYKDCLDIEIRKFKRTKIFYWAEMGVFFLILIIMILSHLK